MTTEELRSAFVIEKLFLPNKITQVYCDADRAIIGGAAPMGKPLKLLAAKKEMAAKHFLERRELGVINVGGTGKVRVDGTVFALGTRDMLYVGRGVETVEFLSEKHQRAAFYFVSYPAHKEYPTKKIPFTHAEPARLGATETANKRTIYKYIHPNGVKSCQLVMGMTELATGSVWNTMPPHTHQRRMEVYMYFDLPADALVVHLMGKPRESRSLVLRNRQAVISPSWSIHCGAATQKYAFVWAMGGENQEFSDMDAVGMKELL
jgi:4-deoxy-L-threo-5-hexosulose-uronate ketol-isomerase